MAAKMVVGYDRYDSSTAALKALHWLPIRSRIEFKVCTLVFRSLQGTALSYLSDILTPAKQPRPGLRSQRKENILQVPFTKRKTFANKAFSVFGPRIWNSLPDNLRTTSDYNEFRRGLKAYLFSKAYH